MLLVDAIPKVGSLRYDWEFRDPTPQTRGIAEFTILDQQPAPEQIVDERAKIHFVCQGRSASGVYVPAPPPRTK
jgi:hypothetical protein